MRCQSGKTYRLLLHGHFDIVFKTKTKGDKSEIFPFSPEGAILMEKIIKIHLEKLPEGPYLATSDDIQGRQAFLVRLDEAERNLSAGKTKTTSVDDFIEAV